MDEKEIMLDGESYIESEFYEKIERLKESGVKISQISETEYVTVQRLRG